VQEKNSVFGLSDFIVIAVTFALFVVALFVKGFTKELLLEVAVFLVSVKLIMSSYRNSIYAKTILSELGQVKQKLDAD